MRVEVRDWFGLLELYVVVERWRPVFKRFNGWAHSKKPRWAVFIVDREWWESLQ